MPASQKEEKSDQGRGWKRRKRDTRQHSNSKARRKTTPRGRKDKYTKEEIHNMQEIEDRRGRKERHKVREGWRKRYQGR